MVVVEGIDQALAEAVGYVRSFAGEDFRAVHVRSPDDPADLVERWDSFCARGRRAGRPGRRSGDAVRALINYVRAVPRAPRDFVTVVVPEQLTKRSFIAALRRRQSFGLKFRLLGEPQVVISDVPVLIERRAAEDADATSGR